MLLSLLACGVLGVVPDLDHDGSVDDDCRPTDPASAPGAPEASDGVDNDCDGVVDEGTERFDDDGDGASELAGDCDDADATIGPAAEEVADGRDQDCDGMIDEETERFDDDGDGASEVEGDCDDTNPLVGPGQAELCDDVDQDCDGLVDEDFDLDADGVTTCDGDTFDDLPDVYPGAPEACDGLDNDLDGELDEGCDGDGDGYTPMEGDCDDGKDNVFPGAAEACDGLDNDCDGYTDERDPDATDADRDGFACAWDCDDLVSGVNPEATEAWNGIDDDCDGAVDEGWDLDGDGVIAPADCDDLDPGRRPDTAEACNGQDDDSDDEVDEGFDIDGDGVLSCWGDCDDGDAEVYPGGPERVNGQDDDCDGTVDNDVGLQVAAQMWITLASDGSNTTTLPLPPGPWDEYAVAVLVDAFQDDGNYCGWQTDTVDHGDEIDVTVTLENCADREGLGYAFRYSVLLFVASGGGVDLDSAVLGDGNTAVPEDVTLATSGGAGGSMSLIAFDNFDDAGDRDLSWNFSCSGGGSSYDCHVHLGWVGNDDCWISGTAILADGLGNATVTTTDFDSNSAVAVSAPYDMDEPDHLAFVTLAHNDTSGGDTTVFVTSRSSGATGESFTFQEFADSNHIYGSVYTIDGDFLYWVDGAWTY